VLSLRRQRCLPMTEEHGAYRTRCKGAPSIFRSPVMTTLKRICLCSPYYSPLPFAAAMLAATPFPHGSGANLAVAGFVPVIVRRVPAMGGEIRSREDFFSP
jgi:hypothetical protein